MMTPPMLMVTVVSSAKALAGMRTTTSSASATVPPSAGGNVLRDALRLASAAACRRDGPEDYSKKSEDERTDCRCDWLDPYCWQARLWQARGPSSSCVPLAWVAELDHTTKASSLEAFSRAT